MAFTKGIYSIGGTYKDLTANTVLPQLILGANDIPGNIIRYKLDIGFADEAKYGKNIRYAAIRVSENRFSNIDRNPVYYTEFRYEGE